VERGASCPVLEAMEKGCFAAQEEALWEMWNGLSDRLLLTKANEQSWLEVASGVAYVLDAICAEQNPGRLPNDKKKAIADELRKEGKRRAATDSNLAHAFGIVCLWLESQTLAGETAARVRAEAGQKLDELLVGGSKPIA
jgi:hypothetical protein